MNASNTLIQGMRDRIATLETERAVSQSQLSDLYQRRNELDDVIQRAALALHGERPCHWSEKPKYEQERDVAKKARAAIEAKLPGLTRLDNELGSRISELKQNLSQAEYEAVSIADLEERATDIIAAIHAANAELASLAAEHESMTAKQGEAEEIGQAVTDAERELQQARSALQQQQAAGFIDSKKIDLAPYNARVSKAEKRLTTARENAQVAHAALPRINGRLQAIDAEQERLRQELDYQRRQWMTNRQWREEIAYRELMRDLVTSMETLAALGSFTGSNLGRNLLEEARRGLRLPGEKGYTREISIAPDIAGAVSRMRAEFDAALLPPPANLETLI